MHRQEHLMQYPGSNPGKRYGRLAGGTRHAEVDYIHSLMATEMVRAENAARTNATLPQPHKSIVGRVKDAVRRRLILFWLKHRDGLQTWIAYRTPHRLLDWYSKRKGSLRERMTAAFKQEGIKDDDIGWVEPGWHNPLDLYTAEGRASRLRHRVFPITLDRADEARTGFTSEEYYKWMGKILSDDMLNKSIYDKTRPPS
jgi:hypothetical protein